MADQVELALANLKKCLDAVGATPHDIISVRQYVVDLLNSDAAVRRDKYLAFMGSARPPVTLLGVATLARKAILYEIEVMAVVHGTTGLDA